MKKEYLFTSKRLGFRNWKESDLVALQRINSDADVMEHFPKTLTKKETEEAFQNLKLHYSIHKYTYFATETLDNKELIGLIGLALQDYKTDFTPAVDIGWRLRKDAWGKGYATEGAKKCLEFGFKHLKLSKIISTCTVDNQRSENVMKKIGMLSLGIFRHPKLKEHPDYEKCLCYAITKEAWEKH